MTGHIATRYVAVKTKSRRPPSWWSGASTEHYTMVKSSVVHLDLAVVFEDVSSSNDLSVPVFEEIVVPSPAPVLDVPTGPVGARTLLPLLAQPLSFLLALRGVVGFERF